ncbi:MAG: hypothetical protein HGA31_00935 [Candidatus Moranbacteria bacterium]|nr:hypothetical protein [Candidatus Moranbacteria bacterium]
MILFDAASILPGTLRKRFLIFQAVLLFLFMGVAFYFGFSLLFPSQVFTYSFKNPDTAKNTLEIPTGIESGGSNLIKGKVKSGDKLNTYAGTSGNFSSVNVRVGLRKDSDTPNDIRISLRRSFRSFFYPNGPDAVSPPEQRILAIDGSPYLFTQEKISPFISDAAALSWAPKEKVLPSKSEILSIFPPQDTIMGFRPGTLLSDAQGVYVIDGDSKAHPIGSTSAFETLGFHWNDVHAISEEELGIHKRGKILLFGAAQPDGSVFLDRTTMRYFLIEKGMKIPVVNKDRLDTLLGVTTPIEATNAALGISASCHLTRSFILFQTVYSCDIPIQDLRDLPGGSFELSLDTDREVHLSDLSLNFRTSPDRQNFSLFLRQLKERFQTVYGNKR